MSSKVFSSNHAIPHFWYNIAADLGRPDDLLRLQNDDKGKNRLSGLLPDALTDQEVSRERWIKIPPEVLDLLYRWRPGPLHRAVLLEKALGTKAKIFYKNETTSPAGGHNANTAVPQAWYNHREGIKTLTTENGAGQWGRALSFACSLVNLKCRVHMEVQETVQSPAVKMMTEAWGGQCVLPSSIDLKKNGGGSRLYSAAESAVLEVLKDRSGKTRYAFRNNKSYVTLHQTIIGLEAKKQLELLGINNVDSVVGYGGSGSQFGGLVFPFVEEKIRGGRAILFAVEPEFSGSSSFHGSTSPLTRQAVAGGLIESVKVSREQSYMAAMMFARTEGLLVSPETGYTLAKVIEEAKQTGKDEKVILFNLEGHGLLDFSQTHRNKWPQIKEEKVSFGFPEKLEVLGAPCEV